MYFNLFKDLNIQRGLKVLPIKMDKEEIYKKE